MGYFYDKLKRRLAFVLLHNHYQENDIKKRLPVKEGVKPNN